MPAADCVEEALLEELHPAVEQVFLGGEVVEDGDLRHVGGPRHLGHSDLIEASVGEQAASRLGDELARLLLLALA